MPRRKLFHELAEGIAEMKAHREQKITLRSFPVEPAPNALRTAPRKRKNSKKQPTAP